MPKRHLEKRYRTGGKTLLGYSINLTAKNVEVYSRRTKGKETTVGVRVSYPSEGYARRLSIIDLPAGVDEIEALHRIADFMDGDWLERVVMGEEPVIPA